jgi:hypothetical protein
MAKIRSTMCFLKSLAHVPDMVTVVPVTVTVQLMPPPARRQCAVRGAASRVERQALLPAGGGTGLNTDRLRGSVPTAMQRDAYGDGKESNGSHRTGGPTLPHKRLALDDRDWVNDQTGGRCQTPT